MDPMMKLTDKELLADYFAHVDAVLLSVTRGDMMRAKAELAEQLLFLERYPHIEALARKVTA